MKLIFSLIYCIFSIFCFSQTNDGETLNNKTIMDLHKAGLGKTVLITKINSSACKFDLSTQKLIELKQAGVEDDIINAMITKSSSNSQKMDNLNNDIVNRAGMNDSMKVMPSGIYYIKKPGNQYMELEPSVYSQANSGSGLLTALTYGIAKTKSKAMLGGNKANLQIEDTIPEFYFYFDRAQQGNLSNSQQMFWFSGATSPNEFILAKFNISTNKKNREVVTGSWNSFEGMTSGIDDAQKITYKFSKLALGIYKVYFDKPLVSGEYCFMYAGGASTGTAGFQKVFDFGIK